MPADATLQEALDPLRSVLLRQIDQASDCDQWEPVGDLQDHTTSPSQAEPSRAKSSWSGGAAPVASVRVLPRLLRFYTLRGLIYPS